MITPGQIYESCDPRDRNPGPPRRIRIESYSQWHNYAYIVTLTPEGRALRHRSISVWDLHDSKWTKNGCLRRRGYALVGNDQ